MDPEGIIFERRNKKKDKERRNKSYPYKKMRERILKKLTLSIKKKINKKINK